MFGLEYRAFGGSASKDFEILVVLEGPAYFNNFETAIRLNSVKVLFLALLAAASVATTAPAWAAKLSKLKAVRSSLLKFGIDGPSSDP